MIRAEALELGAVLRHRPRFRCACVTGTNGKTTTTSMIAAILAAGGRATGRVTTLGAWAGGARLAEDTSIDGFAAAVRKLLRRASPYLAIETTSQALEGGFARDWPADVAVFTNLTPDHLDVHETMEKYLAAKAQLFSSLRAGAVAVLNACDEASALIDEVTPREARRLAYAAGPIPRACRKLPLALAAKKVTPGRGGTRIALADSPLARKLGGEISLRVLGAPNADNALAAAVAADALGAGARSIRRGLAGFAGVPGRFETIAARPLVVVDYAHSPDSLSRVLQSLRALAGPRAKVHLVFGCGGDRDRTKRAPMGRIAGQLADFVTVTNDNPRGEDPHAIAGQIAEGLLPSRAQCRIVLDRSAAIRSAIAAARPGDAVLIAGKGHEREQILGAEKLPFSDAREARAALKLCSARQPRRVT